MNDDNNLRLHEERENIVNASIEANNNIDEKKAVTVNNQIQFKKKNPIVVIIVLIIVFVMAGLLTYYLYQPLKDYLKLETTTTTTITTTKASYITNNSKVRRFQNEKYILILVNEFNNVSNYILYNLENNNLIKGIFKLEDNKLYLDNENYEVTNDKINYKDSTLNVSDSEMKVYISNQQELIVNGTPYHEFAIYLNESGIETGKYTESIEKIIFNDKEFNKDNDYLIFNNDKMIYSY